MAEVNVDWEPIEPPKANRKADAARAAVKGGIGAVPGIGSPLAEAFDFLTPNPTAQDRARWESEVTDGVNTLHDRVGVIERGGDAFPLTLDGAAECAARFLTTQCPDGLAQHFTEFDDIHAVFPDLEDAALRDGLADLESYGLIESRRLVNAPERFKMTQRGYVALDFPVMGWEPISDARVLARAVVAQREGIVVQELHAAQDWPLRRFNPAMTIILGFVGAGRIGAPASYEYAARHFTPSAAELAELRRFASAE